MTGDKVWSASSYEVLDSKAALLRTRELIQCNGSPLEYGGTELLAMVVSE